MDSYGLADPASSGAVLFNLPNLANVDTSQLASDAAGAAINAALGSVGAGLQASGAVTVVPAVPAAAPMSTAEKVLIVVALGALAMAALHIHILGKAA
jgi:hypothetical protein